MNPRLAAALELKRPFFDFIDRYFERREIEGVCDFALGNPHDPPVEGYAAVLQHWAEPQTANWFEYTNDHPEAQQAVATALGERLGLDFRPDDIAMTSGAFPAIALVLETLLDDGDEVIMNTPPWFNYETMIVLAGGRPVKVPVRSDDYDLDIEAIEAAISARTRLVIVNTPNNPTGRVYPPATLQRLADVLESGSANNGRPIFILSDEPYSRILFDDVEFHTPAEFYPHTLISYSYGKILLTPGQRVGFLALAPDLPDRKELRETIRFVTVTAGWLHPNVIMQRAIADLEALSIDLDSLAYKRNVMTRALTDAGYSLRPPEGTFYLWVRSPVADDQAFAERLAEDNVLVLPGSVSEGPGHFRISLTATNDMIGRSLDIFRKAYEKAIVGLR